VRRISVRQSPDAVLAHTAPEAVEVIKTVILLVDDDDVLVVPEPLAIVMVAILEFLQEFLEVVPQLFKHYSALRIRDRRRG
jgi:hypothetical protein